MSDETQVNGLTDEELAEIRIEAEALGGTAYAMPLQVAATPQVVFHGAENDEVVRISLDPPRVTLAPGVDWDGAAKLFWNTVARMAGQEPPFGW